MLVEVERLAMAQPVSDTDGSHMPRQKDLPQAHLIRVSNFLQVEGNTLHQQKDYSSLYCDSHFIVVVRNEPTIRGMPV